MCLGTVLWLGCFLHHSLHLLQYDLTSSHLLIPCKKSPINHISISPISSINEPQSVSGARIASGLIWLVLLDACQLELSASAPVAVISKFEINPFHKPKQAPSKLKNTSRPSNKNEAWFIQLHQTNPRSRSSPQKPITPWQTINPFKQVRSNELVPALKRSQYEEWWQILNGPWVYPYCPNFLKEKEVSDRDCVIEAFQARVVSLCIRRQPIYLDRHWRE